MVLDEDALEAMLKRQRAVDAKQSSGETIKSDETDEYEVYERLDEPDLEPAAPAPETAAPEEEDFEVYGEPDEPEVLELEPAPQPASAEIFAPNQAPAPSHAPAPVADQSEPSPAEGPAPTGGRGVRLAIVQAQFNHELTDQMAALAKTAANEQGATIVHHLQVPGVYDLPLIAQRLASDAAVDAVVVLGAVVKGDTSHDEVITHATARTLQDISCRLDVPIGLGIIGPGMTWRQGEDRVGNATHAVHAVLAQVALLRSL